MEMNDLAIPHLDASQPYKVNSVEPLAVAQTLMFTVSVRLESTELCRVLRQVRNLSSSGHTAKQLVQQSKTSSSVWLLAVPSISAKSSRVGTAGHDWLADQRFDNQQ